MHAFDVDPATSPGTTQTETGPSTVRSFVDERWIGDVLVLSPQGSLDEPVMRHLLSAIDEALVAVVIDLNDCILTDPHVFDLLQPGRIAQPIQQVCISCRRLSARRILSRSRAVDHIRVFPRIEDALRSRILEHNGMGRGWI